MRGFIGLCLLITGLSIGAYSHYPGPAHREASLAELTEIVTGAIPSGQFGGLSREAHAGDLTNSNSAHQAHGAKNKGYFQRRGWFANSKILATEKVAGVPKPSRAAPQLLEKPRRLTAADRPKPRAIALDRRAKPKPVQPVVSTRWRTAVVKVDTTRATDGKRITSLTPKTNAERWKLVKALQSELKRVGCYMGKIDGVWGKGSKWAMYDFMRAVNAALPTQEPDYIQLQLVSSHSSAICGRERRGTVIAQRTKQKLDSGWKAKVARASASPTYRVVTGALPDDVRVTQARRRVPLPGRMAIGALQRDARPQLEAPPTRISRHAVLPRPTKEEQDRQKHLKISALPTEQSAPSQDGRATYDIGEVQIDPVVAKKRSAAKLRRERALRKAAVKKRKRYRRRYRRRSLQSMFMHPLGRR